LICASTDNAPLPPNYYVKPQNKLFPHSLPLLYKIKCILIPLYTLQLCELPSYEIQQCVFSACFRRAPCSHTVRRSATTPVPRERVPPQHLHHAHRCLNTNSSYRFAMFLLMSFQRVEQCTQAITKKMKYLYCEKKSMISRTTESGMKTQYHVSIYRFISLYTVQKISDRYKWICRLYIVSSSPYIIILLITINWNI